MTNTHYEGKYLRLLQDRVSTLSKVGAESQTADSSLNCTISLYKCSVITFITVKDQPVTSLRKM